MPNKPSGTVTFLFSDIEASTVRWEKNAGLMKIAFSRQEAIMRETMKSYEGYVYKMVGDAFQVAFNTARDAVHAAVADQQSLQSEPWGEIGPIMIRMALHTGVVEERAQDYVGPVLNRVARLMSAGHGGQILLSQTTYELLRDDILMQVIITDLGEHRLKDLNHPEHIFQVSAPGINTSFPALITLNAYPNNLPLQLTSFIGRQSQINEILHLLESNRLVTLCGPGGTGKTRLAIQVASHVLSSFKHGVYFIDLAPISDPLLVSHAIAETLCIQENSNEPLVKSVIRFLYEKEILLVLDNFEQIIETAPLISDLLSSAPAIQVMITSRQPLRISGEQEYQVFPMNTPELDELALINEFTQYEAIELFVRRSQSVRPDFEIADHNARAIAEVCTHLDGLPLAIELAAARIRIMDPKQLLNRIEHRFTELKDGMRDLHPRQQTLLATIDWSYDLLEESEKELFTKLSVFQGGRTSEAAAAVCGPGLVYDILSGLQSLTEKNLLFVEQGLDSTNRFLMLETIHDYARQKLSEFGEPDRIKRVHAEHFLELVEKSEKEFRGANQVTWYSRLRSDFDNIRTALSFSFTNGDPKIGIWMAGALRDFWYLGGNFGEGWKWTEIALGMVNQAPLEAQAKLYTTASFLAYYYLLDHQIGVEWAKRALRISLNDGNKYYSGWAHVYLGLNLIKNQDEYKRGIAHCDNALTLFREINYLPGIDQAISVIGELARMAGDYERAEEAYKEALNINRDLGDQYREAINLLNLSYISHEKNDYKQSQDLIKEAVMLGREFNSKYLTATILDSLADPEVNQGELTRAATLLGASHAFFQVSAMNRPTAEQREIDRFLAIIRNELDTAEFETAWAEGQSMSPEDAIAFAFDGEQF